MTRLYATQFGGVVRIDTTPGGSEIREEVTGMLLGTSARTEAETVAAHLAAGWTHAPTTTNGPRSQ